MIGKTNTKSFQGSHSFVSRPRKKNDTVERNELQLEINNSVAGQVLFRLRCSKQTEIDRFSRFRRKQRKKFGPVETKKATGSTLKVKINAAESKKQNKKENLPRQKDTSKYQRAT